MENTSLNPAAVKLHQQARILGQKGRYEETIEKLTQAIQLAPAWVYPIYDLAYTYLLMQDYDMALIYYKQTDDLAPKGFFTSKTAIYTLEGEKAGLFPAGFYLKYLSIEWTENRAEKLEIAKWLTRMAPDFAPAWKELGVLIDYDEERLDAIETGLTKNPDTETKGILLLNKALILKRSGAKEEANNILQGVISSPDSTFSNINLAKQFLRTPF